MPRLERVHSTGTRAELSQHADVWPIQLNLRKPRRNPVTITRYVARSLSLAKELADKEIAKYGHARSKTCKDWIEVR